MKKHIIATAIVSSFLFANSAYSEVKFFGDFEVNTDSTTTANTETTYDQNGRFRLTAFGKHTVGDSYALSQAQLLMHTDGKNPGSTYGDSFIKIGNTHWDLQLGRFQGTKVFDLGNDTGIKNVSNVKVYQLDEARGRIADGGGQIALHYKPTDKLTFELGTVFGDAFLDGETSNGDKTTSVSAVRPTVTFVTDLATFNVGVENIQYDTTTDVKIKHTGYGVNANVNIPNGLLRLSAAYLDDESGDREVTTYSANIKYDRYNLGVLTSNVDNLEAGKTDPSVRTVYMAYVLPVLDIKGTFLTFASSYSTAKEIDDDTKFTSRVRINHYF